MAISYLIAIDSNDDGDLTDLGESIASDILSVEWRLGMSAPYTHVSEPAVATVTVRNQGQEFSPEASSNLIGKYLRIQSNDGTTTRTHFVGFIERIEPQAGNQGKREATIIAYGRELELAQHRVRLPFQTNVRADEAIADILAQVNWRYHILEGLCIIGRDSIGSSDIFPDEIFTTTLDTGISTFAFLADDWADGLPANEAIQQFAQGEGGRFFFNREGNLLFYNRHHLLEDDTVAASFDDDMSGLVYDYGNVVNALEIRLTPRSFGAANTNIWSLANPIKLLKESSIQVIARYEVDDVSVGAIEVIKPQPYIHYQAYSHPTVLNNNMTDDVQVVVFEAGTSAALLEIRNRSENTVYLTQLDIYGTPLITGDELALKGSADLSIVFYGRRSLRMDLPVITDVEEAKAILAWELQRRSVPRGRVRELQTNTLTHPTETLSLTLFDRINIQESQTGHDANYHIVAEHHLVDKGGTRHQVNWLLEAAESQIFFIIGTHSIGSDAVLVPR